MNRYSVAALLLLASGAALAQVWHGPDYPRGKSRGRSRSSWPELRATRRMSGWRSRSDCKFYNAEYAAALNTRGRMPSSAHMAEEQWVRKARDEIVRARKAPPNVRVLTVPRAKFAPSLDGHIDAEEWLGALRIPLDPAAGGAALQLLAYGGQLYLAAHAPADKTEEGFDQFRFWFHINLSPYLTSERVFLAGKGWFAQLREAPKPPDTEPLLESPTRPS